MRIEAIDGKSWIEIVRVPANDWPSFCINASVDIGHAAFSATNPDVALLRLPEFAARLDAFVLDRKVAPVLEGAYDTEIRFRADGRTISVAYRIGGATARQAHALTGGFEVAEGALLSLAQAARALADGS